MGYAGGTPAICCLLPKVDFFTYKTTLILVLLCPGNIFVFAHTFSTVDVLLTQQKLQTCYVTSNLLWLPPYHCAWFKGHARYNVCAREYIVRRQKAWDRGYSSPFSGVRPHAHTITFCACACNNGPRKRGRPGSRGCTL